VGFTDSLHPLSISGAFRAAALRTPGRIALVQQGQGVTYREMLATLDSAAPETEDAIERALLLRAFDNIVEFPVFDRDGASACTLPLDSPLGALAATITMLLGATLHVVDLPALATGIATGHFQTCWLRADEAATSLAAASFRMAFCEGRPSRELVDWLGAERVAEPV
jgi:hypothetical protein